MSGLNPSQLNISQVLKGLAIYSVSDPEVLLRVNATPGPKKELCTITMKNGFPVVILCIIIMLVLQNAGHAQGLQYPPQPNPHKSFISTVGGDILHVFSSPLRFRQVDGLKFLALTAITTVLVTSLDNRIDEDFNERDDLLVKPAIGLAKIGDAYDEVSAPFVLAGLTIPILAGGLIFDDQKLLETTRLMAESYFIAGAITYIGKWAFGRYRPYTGQGPTKFEPFKFHTKKDSRSFPSGHATSAFSMMTVLAKQYDQWWIEIPAYIVAVSVALQRIDSRNHWGADVVVGGAIGYWVGSTLVNRYKQQFKKASINPYIFGNRVAFVVSF
jgi:membrane-associated phospholipid phosphatase